MVSLKDLKPKLEFPSEYKEANTIKSTDLIGKTAEIKDAILYTKEGQQKAAVLLIVDGETRVVYTQSVALVEIAAKIAELGDEFDGLKVKFVGKTSKSGRPYVDMEDA